MGLIFVIKNTNFKIEYQILGTSLLPNPATIVPKPTLY